MIFGESFEAPQKNCSYGESAFAWGFNATSPSATSTTETDTVAPAMHGASSRKITVPKTVPATSLALLHNRGLGNEGLYLESGKPYEGYFFARCDPSAGPINLIVRLNDYTVDEVLASQKIPFKCGKTSTTWEKLSYKLVPSRGAACVGIPVGSDPNIACTRPTNEAGHACIKCAAQFEVGLIGPGSVGLDYVVLQPGPWGRVGTLGVKKSTADMLHTMGISAMRVGGSFASVTGWPDGGGGTPSSTVSGSYYQWQRWTGPPWLRPSVGAVWDAYDGRSYSLIGGWGPFEVIDMANALKIEPILTTTASSSPSELADLVEYCHGDKVKTAMGRKRVADGHPEVYNVKFFELGNEQYNTRFVEQVAAMDARAKTIPSLNGTKLTYIFPDNGGVRGADVDKAKKLGIDAQIAADIHVGADGGLAQASNLFASHPDFHTSAVNLETNGGTHAHSRALQEAADLNTFFNAPESLQKRVLVRTASFCTERSGHFDNFDQGIMFYLPNQTWLQPPGHVHAMIARNRPLNAHNVTVRGAQQQSGNLTKTGGGLSVSAQSSDDGASIVVRVVNPFASPIGPSKPPQITFAVALSSRCKTCRLDVLSAKPSEANPSWDVDRVSPKQMKCTIDGTSVSPTPLLPYSYSVFELSGCA